MNRVEALRTSSTRPGRSLVVLVVSMAVFAVATACGSGSAGGGATTPTGVAPASNGSTAGSGGSTVEISNFKFTPATLTVAVGTTVTWKFDDSAQHTVAADDNSFTSSPMAGGQTYTHTFDTAGTVKYHCSIHSFMTGTIVVK